MVSRTGVFLDTRALFAGIWSSTGGSRMILKLGEAEAIQLLASAQVLQEIENALREKAPGTLGYLALLLERSRVEIVPPPGEDVVKSCGHLDQHLGDIQVIASPGEWCWLFCYPGSGAIYR